MKASLDTSFFIGSWYRLYSPKVFPSLWPQLGKLIESGIAVASAEVKVELDRKPDELLEWILRYPSLIYDTDEGIIELVRAILLDFPNLASPQSLENFADPFVIAVARAQDGVVVCEEKRKGRKKRPKVPDVCMEYGIDCLTPLEFFEEAKVEL